MKGIIEVEGVEYIRKDLVGKDCFNIKVNDWIQQENKDSAYNIDARIECIEENQYLVMDLPRCNSDWTQLVYDLAIEFIKIFNSCYIVHMKERGTEFLIKLEIPE